VGVFPADDDPHPGRPSGKVEQAGDLGDVSALANLAARGDRRRPRSARQFGDGAGQGRILSREPDRILNPSTANLALNGEPVHQFVRGPSPVGAHQQMSAICGGQLGDRAGQHLDVVTGVVAAGVPWSQHDREQLMGVVAPHAKWMKSVAALERRLGLLLF
jgi:hypothetical protein